MHKENFGCAKRFYGVIHIAKMKKKYPAIYLVVSFQPSQVRVERLGFLKKINGKI